ncbi:hypothetical protein PR048_031029 [Dryococelus australis]|uniref:Uncharacterized protein n=1 Tax=Dryococelus australis TaxID=614101 RepID=A0ABQ9G433_9NEOP|nr:hypothetical protein PR048_031029 [Dryococelus australis]
MWVIEVGMGQHRNEGTGETGDPLENPSTNGIVRHDSHMRKSGVTQPGIEPGSSWWEAVLFSSSCVGIGEAQHSPGVISDNHAKPKSGRPARASNPGPPKRESSELPLRHLAQVSAESLIEARYRRQDCTPVQRFARRGDERIDALVSVALSSPTLSGFGSENSFNQAATLSAHDLSLWKTSAVESPRSSSKSALSLTMTRHCRGEGSQPRAPAVPGGVNTISKVKGRSSVGWDTADKAKTTGSKRGTERDRQHEREKQDIVLEGNGAMQANRRTRRGWGREGDFNLEIKSAWKEEGCCKKNLFKHGIKRVFWGDESCRTMPLVGGFSRGSLVSSTPSFRRCSMLTSITLIGSQDIAVKSRPNLFTHSLTPATFIKIRFKNKNAMCAVIIDHLKLLHRLARMSERISSVRSARQCRPRLQVKGPQFDDKFGSNFSLANHAELKRFFVNRKRAPNGGQIVQYILRNVTTQSTVAEWLACSPLTKAIRVQPPAGTLRIFACGNRAGRCRWSASFLGDLPFPAALSFRRCSVLTSIILIGSQDLDENLNQEEINETFNMAGEADNLQRGAVEGGCVREGVVGA